MIVRLSEERGRTQHMVYNMKCVITFHINRDFPFLLCFSFIFCQKLFCCCECTSLRQSPRQKRSMRDLPSKSQMSKANFAPVPKIHLRDAGPKRSIYDCAHCLILISTHMYFQLYFAFNCQEKKSKCANQTQNHAFKTVFTTYYLTYNKLISIIRFLRYDSV